VKREKLLKFGCVVFEICQQTDRQTDMQCRHADGSTPYHRCILKVGKAHGERGARESVAGVWGQSPQRGPGAETLVRGSGDKTPLKPKHFSLSEVQIRRKFAHFC